MGFCLVLKILGELPALPWKTAKLKRGKFCSGMLSSILVDLVLFDNSDNFFRKELIYLFYNGITWDLESQLFQTGHFREILWFFFPHFYFIMKPTISYTEVLIVKLAPFSDAALCIYIPAYGYFINHCSSICFPSSRNLVKLLES